MGTGSTRPQPFLRDQEDQALSTSKKPGTDLAALKARLAKKNKGKEAAGSEAAAPEPAQVEDALPPPGQSAPEPTAAPEPVAAAPVAAPEPVAAAPAAEAAPVAQPQAPASDDPFGGGGGGGFDPNAGVLDDVGDVKPKSGVGLMIFAAIIGLGIGAVGGSLGKEALNKRSKQTEAKAKGAAMASAAKGVSEARIDISRALDGWKAKMATDPVAVAKEINTLLKEKYEKQIRLDDLFGPDFAAVGSAGQKRTSELFYESQRLKKDLQALATFLAKNEAKIKQGIGPANFGIEFKAGMNKLVALTGALCGETVEVAKPCTGKDVVNAVAYTIIDNVGEKSRTAARGVQPGQVQLLSREGGIFRFAVGIEPNKNAVAVAASLVQRIDEHLESMIKAEKVALAALERYAADPSATPQADPEE